MIFYQSRFPFILVHEYPHDTNTLSEGVPKEKTSLVPSLAWPFAKHTAQNARLPIYPFCFPLMHSSHAPKIHGPEKPNDPKL
jgi:hypothetical protein